MSFSPLFIYVVRTNATSFGFLVILVSSPTHSSWRARYTVCTHYLLPGQSQSLFCMCPITISRFSTCHLYVQLFLCRQAVVPCLLNVQCLTTISWAKYVPLAWWLSLDSSLSLFLSMPLFESFPRCAMPCLAMLSLSFVVAAIAMIGPFTTSNLQRQCGANTNRFNISHE